MTRDRDNPMHPDMWYVAVENRTVGPVTTELILRGLESGKVPHDAMVCPVGANDWSWVSTVEPFVDLIRQSQPSPPVAAEPPADDDYEDEETLVFDKQSAAPEPLPPVHTESDEPYEDRVPSLYGMDVAFAKAAAAAPPHFQSRPPDPPLPPPSSTVRSSGARVPPPPVPPGPLPPPASAPEPTDEREASLPPPPLPPAARARDEEDGIDITVDLDEGAPVPASEIDWTQPFVQQLDLPRGCTLPEDSALLASLAKASTTVLLEEDAMWNLALCISFGSMAVATIAADRFFETVVDEHAEERLAWITRVLLSKGFMPSGIPQENGLRGIRVLRDNCPDELRVALERHVLS
jgi:hypothetical protein